MLTLKCLKEYPNIIDKINTYLEPIILKNNLELSLRNYPSYNKNFYYLIKNNIIIKYALDYARYPEKTMSFLCQLSKIMPINDAYDILMIIPFQHFKINNINYNYLTDETIINKLILLLNYNYSWTYVLFNRNISIVMIKELLHKLHDFYFFELFFINTTLNDINKSYQMIISNLNNTNKYKENFMKLRLVKVPHTKAYYLSRYDDIFINKILDIAQYGYYNVEHLSIICYFDEKQINFLKLSRYGFINEIDFNKYKNNIVEKAFLEELFDDTYFEPNDNTFEPDVKRMKVN
jgi:hypothetical protein